MDERDEAPEPAAVDDAAVDDAALDAAAAELPGLIAARDLTGLARVLIQLDQSQSGYYFFGDHRRLQPLLDMGSGDVLDLIRQIGHQVLQSGAVRPSYLLCGLSETLPAEAVPLVCADWLAGMDRTAHVGDSGEVTRMARAFVASGTPLSSEIIAAIRRTVTTPLYGKTIPVDQGDLDL